MSELINQKIRKKYIAYSNLDAKRRKLSEYSYNRRKELGLDIDPSTLVKVYVPSTRSRFFLVRKHFRLASIE